MKKIISIASLVIAVCGTSFGQGLVYFNNYIGVTAPVTLDGSVSELYAGNGFEAALFVSGTEGIGMTPLATADFFAAGTGGEGFFDSLNNGINDVAIPGVAAGEVANLVVAVWDSATMGSTVYGTSSPFSVTTGGGTSLPASLTTLQGFDVTAVPEPSTIAMIALGLGAVVFRFRRK